MSVIEEIEKINESIRNCKKCPLYKFKTNYVPGDGDPNSEIIFIGEAPGAEEDKKGLPFVGKAGKYLTEKIENILNINRKDIYITNLIKCRPPNNRNPTEEEIEKCSEWLIKQIEIIKPRILVTLGRYSTEFIFKYFGLNFKGILKEHGNIYYIERWNKKVIIFPTLHPAAVLYKPYLKELFEKDFEKLRKIIRNKNKNNNSVLKYFKLF